MSLIRDIRDSFKSKGLEYVSVVDSKTRNKTTLTYKDSSGKTVTREIDMPLSEVQDTIQEVDVIDPDGLADFLLGTDNSGSDQAPPG